MNLEQLAALLSAGLITPSQYTYSLAQLQLGPTSERPELELELPVHQVKLAVAADGAVTVTGDITEYDVLIPSHGILIESGSLSPRSTTLSDIKMLRDHDQAQPVGFMTSIDKANKRGEFRIAATEAQRVQQEFEDKLRDGLSIGLNIQDYSFDENDILHVHQGNYVEVSLCALPAAVNARVTDVAAALATAKKENTTMNRAQLAAALAAGTITQEQHDAGVALLVSIETATNGKKPTEKVEPEVEEGPELSQKPSPVVVHERTLSLRDVTERLTEAFNTGRSAATVNLAINDVIPSDDAGTAFINRSDWQGEMWTANDDTRTWIDAIGIPKEMKSLKTSGWVWGTKPSPEEYAGDKAEVPSGDATTVAKNATAFRAAGGWDVDRAYVDFADEEFLSSFWSAATSEYKKNSNTSVRTRVGTAETAKANVTAGGSLALIKTLFRDARTIGGRIDRVFLGDTMWDDFSNTPSDSLPIWLKNALVGVDVAEGTADVGVLHIVNDSSVETSTAEAFDSRALYVEEKAPLNLQAVDIAHAGIDLGFYSYLKLVVTDPRLLIKRKYVAA